MPEDTRLIDLLAEWEERRGQGQSVSAETLASGSPELLTELKRRISDLEKVGRILDTSQTVKRSTVVQSPLPLPSVPGYEVLEVLGQGGMGVVYKARQVGLGRLVALKMIRAGRHAGTEELARFRIEAEAVARLQHPHIVQIHEIGELDGLPFFSLEYVDGGSLAQKLAGGPLPAEQAAALLEVLARAMHAAHQHGIIHRDLKPANVLLTADGVPRISDFGLARRLDVESGQTRTGDIMGTPSYMAPEQAAGDISRLGPATDIHALGAILYEMLTGRPPFLGATPLDTLLQVKSQEPVPPRQLQPKVPRDLETICLKCLHKEPPKRYADAVAMADDLRGFLNNEPIKARPTPQWERAVKWARRRPAIAGLLSLVVAVTALGFGGIMWQWLRAEDALEATELARQEEEKERIKAVEAGKKETAAKEDARRALGEALVSLYAQRIATADRAWWAKDVAAADRALDECRPPELRGWEWHYLKRQCHAELLTFRGHQTSVISVAYSPDGARLASGSVDGTIKVWDAATGKEAVSWPGHDGSVLSLVFSRDGQRLATGSADQTVKVWNAITGQEVLTLQGNRDLVGGVAFHPDGQHLASASQDGTIRVWETVAGKEVLLIRHGPTVSRVVYSPDGQHLASAGGYGTVKVWDATSGMEVLTLKPTGAVLCVTFSPDGKQLAAGSSNQLIKVWNAATGQEIHTLRGHGDWVKGVAYSPDGKRLATASYDQTVMVWDALTGKELFTLRGHTREVHGVAFQPGGNRLASASMDGTVKVWNAAAQEALTLQGHKYTVFGVAYSPDGQRIASASGDKTLKLWDAATKQVAQTVSENAAVFSVAYSPDRRHLATANNDRIVRIRDAATGQDIHTLKGHTDKVGSVAYSPDGERLVSGSADNTVIVWDARTGKELFTLRGHTKEVRQVAFSPDGWRVASASTDRTVKVWDATTGNELFTLAGHSNMVFSVAFSPDGRRLASGSAVSVAGRGVSGEVRIWDPATGKEVMVLHDHTHLINSLAFSPDGRRPATASDDRTVRVWDAVTLRHALTLRGHATEVQSVAWSPDSQYLVSAGSGGTIKVWDGATWTAE